MNKDITKSRYYDKYVEAIKKFRIIDDTFMKKVFEDEKCVHLLLKIILEKDDLKILSSKSQFTMKNLQGHSLTLDIFAEDSKGVKYNIEVQRSNEEANPKRARYHSSLIDANILDTGDNFKNLAETYVIFITEKDVLKKGLPIYHIDRTIRETNDLFNDESHIIYVNAQIQDETALGKLMHDFMCAETDKLNYDVLSDRVKLFKENEKGVSDMCAVMEELFAELEELVKEEAKAAGIAEGRVEGIATGRAEGRAAGIAEGKAAGIAEGKTEGKTEALTSTAIRMLKSGRYSNDEISLMTDIKISEIEELAKEYRS